MRYGLLSDAERSTGRKALAGGGKRLKPRRHERWAAI
jgi:hypothetical protein